MNEQKFVASYNASRNGCNEYYRHWASRSFLYTDGVKELADQGMRWLVDIVATEIPAVMRSLKAYNALLHVVVTPDNKANLLVTTEDGAPPVWQKKITYTDLPQGTWVFELGFDGNHVVMLLLSEH